MQRRLSSRPSVSGRLAGAVVISVALVAPAACGTPVDLAKDLKVVDVETGWFDAGIVNGKNKLVPDIAFALQNTSGHPVESVQVNLAFWRKNEDGEFDDAFLATAIDRAGLAPSATTSRIRLRGKVGYTSEVPRAEMLQHRLFVDATVRIFAKHGSAQWVSLGEFPIERRVLTR